MLLFSMLDFLIPASGAGKALMAAILLGAGCGVLGCFVVLRRVALMGDAVSQSLSEGEGWEWFVYDAIPLGCAVYRGMVFFIDLFLLSPSSLLPGWHYTTSQRRAGGGA